MDDRIQIVEALYRFELSATEYLKSLAEVAFLHVGRARYPAGAWEACHPRTDEPLRPPLRSGL